MRSLWARRAALAALAFFTVKGLAWLALAAFLAPRFIS